MRTSHIAPAFLVIFCLSPAVALGATRSTTESPVRVIVPVSSSSSSSSSVFLPSYRSSTPALQVTPKKVRSSVPITGTALFNANANSCPIVPTKMPAFPTPVYNLTEGDCSLKGKGAQITAYLKKLKAIANGCKKQMPAQLAKAKQAKKNLDVTIDGLPVPDPELKFFAASASCNGLSSPQTEAFEISKSTNQNAPYSAWLDDITLNTIKYCTMIHEIIKPLAVACATMASEVQCQLTMQQANGISDADKKGYHSTIALAMKSATLTYNNLDSFYKKTLSASGWGNFESLYKESNITCGNGGSAGIYNTKEEE